jgi:hypothetical protein
MEKEFVLYEQALALKELGFDEPCFAYFKDEEFQYPNPYEPFKNSEMKSWCITAPLYQQSFRWFREKYGLKFYIRQDIWNHWCSIIMISKDGEYAGLDDYDTYQEAELECLKKLIEIVKTK